MTWFPRWHGASSVRWCLVVLGLLQGALRLTAHPLALLSPSPQHPLLFPVAALQWPPSVQVRRIAITHQVRWLCFPSQPWWAVSTVEKGTVWQSVSDRSCWTPRMTLNINRLGEPPLSVLFICHLLTELWLLYGKLSCNTDRREPFSPWTYTVMARPVI